MRILRGIKKQITIVANRGNYNAALIAGSHALNGLQVTMNGDKMRVTFNCWWFEIGKVYEEARRYSDLGNEIEVIES